jgi:prepilin-type N-terminal cleavage/methylation domain-containing protein
MRKGFSIVEVLVVLGIISIISIPLARLSTTTFRDIPRSYRMIQANTSMLSTLKQMHKDINAAKDLPKSSGKYTTNNEVLLIELADGMICYQLKDDEIVRRKLTQIQKDNQQDIMSWPVPHAKIKWQVRRGNNKGYGVEIKTYIEQRSGDRLEKKMANSYLYFVGVYQEAIR